MKRIKVGIAGLAYRDENVLASVRAVQQVPKRCLIFMLSRPEVLPEFVFDVIQTHD